jgi:hypothetical protein
MTSSERSALLARDRLQPNAIEPLRKRVQVISPTVTRRPALDCMLGDIAIIAQSNLEAMRVRSQGGDQLNEDEIGDFRHYCELVFKQARLEMAVEKHIEERTATMDADDIGKGVAEDVQGVLFKFNIKQEVADAIMLAILAKLGLDE